MLSLFLLLLERFETVTVSDKLHLDDDDSECEIHGAF